MMSNKTPPELCAFTTDQLDGVVRLSKQAGWPHRREDLALIVDNSEGVVLMADNSVVGSAFTACFGPRVTMLNMIMVDESMRRRGFGRTLMTRVMALADRREQRLIATKAGMALYEQLGFVSTGVVLQHQGSLAQVADPDGISWYQPDDCDAIVALDTQATGMQRGALIKALAGLGRIAVLRDGSSVKGFAALRAFGLGQLAGPVVAHNSDDARALLSFLFSTRSGEFMRVDTDTLSGLSPWLEQIGLTHVDQGIHMVLDPSESIDGNLATTYALANQALG